MRIWINQKGISRHGSVCSQSWRISPLTCCSVSFVDSMCRLLIHAEISQNAIDNPDEMDVSGNGMIFCVETGEWHRTSSTNTRCCRIRVGSVSTPRLFWRRAVYFKESNSTMWCGWNDHASSSHVISFLFLFSYELSILISCSYSKVLTNVLQKRCCITLSSFGFILPHDILCIYHGGRRCCK